jgi:hypothetical protein
MAPLPTFTPTPLLTETQTPTQTPIVEKDSNPIYVDITPILPTDEFSIHDEFGDGYIASIKVEDVKNSNPDKIVNVLVTQWLEHYKTESRAPRAAIEDFVIDDILMVDNRSNDTYVFVAKVAFSIIPSETPSDFGSFPGEPYDPKEAPWWHIGAPFGVIQVGNYYYLRMVFGWGT